VEGSILPVTGAAGQDPNAVYPLGSSLGESARRQRQAEELAAATAALLDRVGLRPGQRAIDLGCGPRGILDMLAERVAPACRVVGLDSDPAHAAMAAEFAAAQRLNGVEVITADARSTGLPTSSFDLVHARTLLVNLATPPELDELDAAARRHLDDPRTVVMSGLLFLTWGRKPDHAKHDSQTVP
jgi:SAM-dependent methyltransferase